MADLDHSLWRIKSFDRWEQRRLQLRGSHLCAACQQMSIERLRSSPFTFFPKVGIFETDQTNYPEWARYITPDKDGPRCSFCDYFYMPKAPFIAELSRPEHEPQRSYGPRLNLVYHPDWTGLKSMEDNYVFDLWTDEGDPSTEFGVRAKRSVATTGSKNVVEWATQSLLPWISGKQWATCTGSKKATEWAKQNLLQCASGHIRCSQTLAVVTSKLPFAESGASSDPGSAPASGSRLLPARLIDLNAHPSLDAALVDTISLSDPVYAALSYCWGTGIDTSYKTTEENISQHQQCIEYLTLPLTIRQAFNFVRTLGVRYLWVDALCIIQGSVSDWDQESAKMHGTYGHAYVTLAADYGESVESLSDGRTSSLYFCGTPSTIGRERLDSTAFGGPLSYSKLADRAWAFQERRLSPRIIHFNDRQIIWECRELIISEDNTWYAPIPTSSRDSTLAPCILFEPLKDLSILPDFWYGQIGGVLEQFTACRLTLAEDKLPAISGMAAKIATVTSSPYIAGLWLEHSLQRGLAWHRSTNVGFVWVHQPDRGPSFSWAAWDGLIQWETSNAPPAFVIDGHSVSLEESNPFGRVGPRSLTLTGRMIYGSIEATKMVGDVRGGNSHHARIEDREVGIVLMDSMYSPAVDDVGFFQLFESEPTALALERTMDGQHRRLGLARLKDEVMSLFNRSEYSTITLV